MSARLVGLVLEHYPAGGGELLLAIALADEADHNGGNIRATLPLLARLSRQSEQHVRKLMRKMEQAAWLVCAERSPGGRGKPSSYRIAQDWISLPVGWAAPKPESNARVSAAKPETNPNLMRGFRGSKPESNARVSGVAPFLLNNSPPIPPQTEGNIAGSAVPSASDVALLAEDARMARWIFSKISELHPNHREPNWKRWEREIRLMRTVDQRTHRQIAELFAWANADRTRREGSTFCWATVILSPGKLRLQWDKLEIQRKAATPAKPAGPGPLCSRCNARPWTRRVDRTALCSACAEQVENEAHA